jgi:hypothetical protein
MTGIILLNAISSSSYYYYTYYYTYYPYSYFRFYQETCKGKKPRGRTPMEKNLRAFYEETGRITLPGNIRLRS